MEKEQKRLSRYQSEQAESAGASSEEYIVTRKTHSKDQNGNQLKCKKANTAAHKYVVDHTKPKTDLEYDPCSNFSADLRSGSSTDKMKSANKADVEHDQRDKGKGKSVSADPVPVPFYNFEDSDEEGELVIDIPLVENDGNKRAEMQTSSTSEKGKEAEIIEPTKKCMTNISEQQMSPESLYEETGVVKPSHSMLQKIPSEGAISVTNRANDSEQNGSIHPKIAKEQLEMSKRMLEITALPAENNQMLHKNLIHNVAASKNDKCKEENLNYATQNSLELHENARSSSVVGFSQVCPLEKPILANIMSKGDYEEKTQSTVNLVDDISFCLDHLRRESESIVCLQDVNGLVLDTIHSAPSCSKMHGDHYLQPVTHKPQKLPELEVQPNSMVHMKKMDTFSLRHSPESPQKTSVSQDYLTTTSSFPATTKDPGSYQNSSTSVETNWPFAHKLPTEPVVQNVPLYVPGTNTTMAPSPHMELNPATTSTDLIGGQILQKAPALLGATDDLITNESSSSEELNYSDLELSESDPMEECYRIFMEANEAEDPTAQGDMPVSGWVYNWLG